jgi:hypothetical protein
MGATLLLAAGFLLILASRRMSTSSVHPASG